MKFISVWSIYFVMMKKPVDRLVLKIAVRTGYCFKKKKKTCWVLFSDTGKATWMSADVVKLSLKKVVSRPYRPSRPFAKNLWCYWRETVMGERSQRDNRTNISIELYFAHLYEMLIESNRSYCYGSPWRFRLETRDWFLSTTRNFKCISLRWALSQLKFLVKT